MDYVIQTEFQGPGFVAVPNAVAQMENLSAEALGVLVWLASLPKGFLVRRSGILSRFRIGRDKWQRIARELTDHCALRIEKDRLPGGQFVSRYVVKWPEPERVLAAVEPEPENPVPVETAAENPHEKCGKPAQKVRKTRSPIQKKDIKTRAKAKPPEPRQPKRLAPVGREGSGDLSSIVSTLVPFQLTCLREGKSVLVDGSLWKPDRPDYQRLRQAAGIR